MYDVVGVASYCFSSERNKIATCVRIHRATLQPMHYTPCCAQ